MAFPTQLSTQPSLNPRSCSVKLRKNSCKMTSIWCSFGVFVPHWRQKSEQLLIFLPCKTRISFIPHSICRVTNDDSVSLPKQKQLGFDPSEELFGLEVDLKPGNIASSSPKPRSWFGPNGQYIRELPCPSCRGRGYTPCTQCGIERSRLDCSICNGKGIMTCRHCLGDCVIWEESIDEQPWEKAHLISPLKVKEDDDVDNLDIKVHVKKKSKRVYHSPSPEVGLKISRALKSLNAKTGLFSKRMKIIHRDPKLHAQRVAAIKKAKGTPAARKRASEALKAFFSDPENRHKRSLAMRGVKFYCKNCGREGHRRFYCPELKDSTIDRQFRCRLCGEKGHNRRTCPQLRLINHNGTVSHHRCKICRQNGHNRRTCPQVIGVKSHVNDTGEYILPSRTRTRTRTYSCRLCRKKGHNKSACPSRNVEPLKIKPEVEERNQQTSSVTN